jgi:hypothetical protein
MPFSFNVGGLTIRTGHTGSAPSPFDAINGPRLAGPEGSHPLHMVRAEELLRPGDGAVTAEFSLDGKPRVGDGLTGKLKLTANKQISSRKAYLRLVGLRLDEVRKSEEHEDASGHTTSSDHWVEVSGKLFVTDSFVEPAIPTQLEPGQTFEAPFAVPMPKLGPPTAHLGESIIAWALEVRWDVAMGSDHFAALYLPLAQHPDLIRAGVGKQGGQSLMASVPVQGGQIDVTSPLPAPAGSEITVTAAWPSAPDGRAARVELRRKTNAPNGQEGIVASAAVDPAALHSGSAQAKLLVPEGTAPSFDGAGLEITYVIRVLVDRKFRSDAAIERPVAIV